MDAGELARLDARGIREVGALTYIRSSSDGGSLASPWLFATEGAPCWLKKDAQAGLAAELIGGRLAALVGAGPLTHVIAVPQAALKSDGSLGRFLGQCCGSEDLPGTENSKFLAQKGITLENTMIDKDQRALVVAFQTWLRVQDHQVMVDFASGRVYSHDHGECFGDLANPLDMPLVVAGLNGVDPTHGSDGPSVERAVGLVEGCSDAALLDAVARVPDGWGADAARRLEIAEWLGQRRDTIRQVMAGW